MLYNPKFKEIVGLLRSFKDHQRLSHPPPEGHINRRPTRNFVTHTWRKESLHAKRGLW
jgi:hypothetical protein